ncbi:PucR family transcriptional regulator [Nocardia sp. NBC_01329]|uniref:PucR family transcriptional regulator n=1 Tax=Nocardia sp. NBC_01329 TaxID=2903594 RepID=UPI002E11EE1B|nr:helix-turn-helix domain-containing protein [Nocardia sp. NBC_01329]
MEQQQAAHSTEEVVGMVAQTFLRDRDQFIDQLSHLMRTQVPILDQDPRLRELMEAGTTDNLMEALQYLQNEAAEDDVRAPERALVYARILAQRDVPASALIRAYRVGQAGFLDTGMRYAIEFGGGGPVTTSAIVHIVNRTSVYIDRVCEQVGVAYEEERDRWVGNRGGLRQQWVTRLLNGTTTDADAAEQALRYPLSRGHLAIDTWTDPHIDPAKAVEVFDQLRAALGTVFDRALGTLLIPVDEHEARLWFALPGEPSVDSAAIEQLLADRALPVRVAFGGHGTGLAGFRRTAAQADRVRRLALLSGDHGARVLSYHDVSAVALLASDIDTLREFVADELGELAVDNERNLWLRETLRVFLAGNRSYAAAATRLGVHRNTVQYRVRQALNLIGVSTDSPGADLYPRLALQATQLLGAAVLRPESGPN